MSSKDLQKGLPAEVVMETQADQAGEVFRHVFEEDGKVVYMNEKYYIRFEETSEDGRIPVTLKIHPDGMVDLIRRGEPTTRLTFNIDQETLSNYSTPMGIMQLRVVTEDLKISYYDRPFSGSVSVDYVLYLEEQLLGTYQIRLRFTT